MPSLGDRLKRARERKGLSQMEVSRRTNINNKTLSRYENGGSEPDVGTLNTLASHYDVSVDWLTGNEKKNGAQLDEVRKELLDDFDKLSPDDQQYVLGLIKRIRKE